MPPPTLQVTLDPDAQAELERRYQTTRDAPTRTRYQMVLLNAEGHTPPQVAQLVRCSPERSAGCSSATWPAGPTPCRTGPSPASRPTPAGLGGRAGPGGRPGPTLGWGGQRAVELRLLADYLGTAPGTGRGSRRSAWPCTAPGTCASGPAGCSRARPRPSRGGQKTPEGGGAAWRPRRHRCLHPQPTWSRMRPWPPTCSPRICRACWGCSGARTCTCKTRSRSPCTRP